VPPVERAIIPIADRDRPCQLPSLPRYTDDARFGFREPISAVP
jgi:hypothetical protein